MYRLIVIALLVFTGCQQQMPTPADAFTEEDRMQIEEEIRQLADEVTRASAELNSDRLFELSTQGPAFAYLNMGYVFSDRNALENSIQES